jgi:hypothetical protein
MPTSSKDDASEEENGNDTASIISKKSKTSKISSVVGVLTASLSKLSPRRSPKRKHHVQIGMTSAAPPISNTNPDTSTAMDDISEQGVREVPTFLCHDIMMSGNDMMLKPAPSTFTQVLLPDILLAEEQSITENMENNADTLKSISFAKSLKTYGCISYKERVDQTQQKTVKDVVVQFNVMSYLDKCSSGSPHYDASFNLDIIAAEVFKSGEVWANRELVKDALTAQSNCQGFTIKVEKDWIGCNRVGAPDKNHGRRDYMTGTLKANCTLRMCMKALSKHREKKENQKKFYYTNDWTGPVMFSDDPNKMCTTHGGDCTPSVENKIATAQRAGSFIKSIPDQALYNLCNMLDHNGFLKPSTIRDVMGPVWPSRKVMTKHDLFNINVKVMRLLPILKVSDGRFDEFQKLANANQMFAALDHDVSLDDDEAYAMSHAVLLEVKSAIGGNGPDAVFKFVDYLELIAERAKGFTFKLASDTSSSSAKRKLTGVVWMTATMRRHFELFGDYISLDMMKRGLNTLLWPYNAVVMYNELNKICIACEGILCGEQVEMYQFVSSFLAESVPGRPLSTVKIVAGDGYFDQEMIFNFGFTNAVFLMDQFHLLDSGLAEYFGITWHALLKSHLQSMIHAKNEEDFNDVLNAAIHLVRAQPVRDGIIEQKLQDFAAKRSSYAQYCIDLIPGNRGWHGSSSCEQNHSSTLVYLNDGNKMGNNYMAEPADMISKLMER